MKNIIITTALFLITTTSLLASDPINEEHQAIAQISFYLPHSSENYDSQVYHLELFVDGRVEVMAEGFDIIVTHTLNNVLLDRFIEMIFFVGQVDLHIDSHSVICRTLPPEVDANLSVMNFSGSLEVVLTEPGCWRKFSVKPAQKEALQRAIDLREQLITLGKEIVHLSS